MKTYIFIIALFGIYTMRCQDISGKWLQIKNGDTHSIPNVVILEFQDDTMVQYDFDKPMFSHQFRLVDGELFVNNHIWGKVSFINNLRFSLSAKANKKIKETVFNMDYVRLMPTDLQFNKDEIEKHSYNFKWNNEEKIISFNKDKPIYDMNEHSILESVGFTFFISIYRNGIREIVIPIKTATSAGMELYGMPGKPYSVIAPINK
ncbi:hypothetical protein [Spongiimicrobium sp. 3-5]|uniref:hypothetical protein n=1 Tax=Spongiimicrobium sp. 3-5 TaxID=3332596 RepID=UPI00398035A9